MKHLKLATFLKNSRKKAGLTQMDVADQLGYGNSQFVSNWERGQSVPPLNAIRKLSKLYRVNMDELFELIFETNILAVEESLREQYSKIRRQK